MTTPSPLPTDEDREALRNLLYRSNVIPFEAIDVLADRILAAGFRRSVVSTSGLRALIKEARERTTEQARQNPEGSVDLARRLADALEAAVSAPPTITDEIAVILDEELSDLATRIGKDRIREIASSIDARARAALGGEA